MLFPGLINPQFHPAFHHRRADAQHMGGAHRANTVLGGENLLFQARHSVLKHAMGQHDAMPDASQPSGNHAIENALGLMTDDHIYLMLADISVNRPQVLEVVNGFDGPRDL